MQKSLIPIFMTLLAVACGRETVTESVDQATTTNTRGRLSAEVPLGPRLTREEIERERLNAAWRQLRSFQRPVQRVVRTLQPRPERIQLNFVQQAKFGEKLDSLSLQNLDRLPITVPISGDVAGPSVLRAQVLLDRIGYSPGIIDGRWGKNTAIAVYWFQGENDLEATGDIDEPTFRAIARAADYPAVITEYVLTPEDVSGPFTKVPEDVYEQEKLDCLCYESMSEKLSEKFHATTELMKLLNPGVDLDSVQSGQRLRVLNVRPPFGEGAPKDVQRVVVSVEGNYLHALDPSGRVLFHAPTTVGSKYDPSPDESTKIVGIAHDPHFHYQPKLFHEVPDTNPEANLQPGPNSPVGVVWMALSKPHYGIHGTGDPDSIGYASSHGCIRLTNWDANDLSRRVTEGLVVEFVDTRGGTPKTDQ